MNRQGLPELPASRVIRHEVEAIRGQWIWLVALGVSLIVMGTILVGFPVIATLATVALLGVLILLGGALEVAGSFWCRNWSGFFVTLLSGILGVVIGVMLLHNPIQGGIALTILLSSFLFIGGIFKTVGSLTHRFGGWIWILVSGVIDIALALLIWHELPASGLTIIGLLVGISTIFRGVSWLMLGIALKQSSKLAA